MKRFIVFFLIYSFSNLNAQIHEVGVFLGGSNYVGEIGKTNYIDPNEFAYGFIYKWNKSPRHSYRFSISHAKISSKDIESDVSARNIRGYEFENSITEISGGLEFNFFDFNLHQMERKITPYVFSGLTYSFYDGLYFSAGTAKIDSNTSTKTLAIPIIVGVKSNITPHIIIGAEVGARYTFVDDLDGSNPTNAGLQNFKFGNINSNDWYVFSGITLTYTFGEKPCYCKE